MGKEYNYKKYKKKVIAKRVEKWGGLEDAIFAMDAIIADQKMTITGLRELLEEENNGEV